jgi:hypothetical protein
VTTMIPIKLHCPNCGDTVDSDELTSTNYVGRTTELKPITMGFEPLLYLIHSCQNCGFTGDGDEFSGQIAPAVASRIQQEIQPHMRDERISVDARWEFAALIAEWRGQPAEAVGQLYLNAAWCAQEIEREIYCRRRAADWFEQALDGGVDDPVILQYRIGELYRRIGDIPVAHRWFDAAITDADGHPHADSIRALAQQQKTDPREEL